MSTRGADLLVQALRRAGVRVVFSLSGNHVMPVYDALIGSGIRLVHTRHEAAAVHMADGFARVSGGVGIALVTGGPGHANALGALYTALMAESAVVLLSGHAARGELGRGAFQEMRQAEMAAPVCKASWTCADAAGLAADAARAVQLARSGRPGPVHLSLPADTLEARCASPLPPAAAFAAQPQPLGDADAGRVLQWLNEAQRPLILAGPGALAPPARARIAVLREASGIPLVGMESPRGIADPALGALADLLPRADAILLLAKRLDFTLAFGRGEAFAPQVRWAQIDADAAEIERTRHAVGDRLGLQALADLPGALDALAARAAAQRPAPCAAWRAEVAQALAWRPPSWRRARSAEPDRLHPVQALRPLQPLLDSHPDALLVGDGGEFGQWAQAVLHAPQRLINGVAGSIGSALPLALGARCATGPDVPIVAVSGDGSIGFHLAEFDTAVREGLQVLVVVGNDARWNAEHQIQLRTYGDGRQIGCELLPTRYDRAAAALGAFGASVGRPRAWRGALARALAQPHAACLNVAIEGLAAPRLRRPAAR